MANAEAMFAGANVDLDSDVIVSWLPCFHDMGMTGYLSVPMYYGAELVKVTPLDFLRDTLLWAKLIDKYQATMTAAPNFAYNLFAKRLRRQATPGQFDLSSLRWALSGAESVEPADVEDLCQAGARFGLTPQAIVPAYGMAETTVAVSFSQCGDGMVVDEVDADLLSVLHRAVPAAGGHTRRLACLGRPLDGLQVRIVEEDATVVSARGVGVIEVRGKSVTPGYTTAAGFVSAQDEQGWYNTGDLGYLTESGDIVVCGRLKDVIIMAGRKNYPSDIERAAARVSGVRPGCTVAVRLHAGLSRETFAVAVESTGYQQPATVRRIQRQVAHEVFAEVDVRPPHRGGAGAGDDSQDTIGNAAARARRDTGELIGLPDRAAQPPTAQAVPAAMQQDHQSCSPRPALWKWPTCWPGNCCATLRGRFNQPNTHCWTSLKPAAQQ